MGTLDKILANVILAILLTSCYLLLPITLMTAYTLQGLTPSYLHLVGLLRSWYHGITYKCLHLMIIPVLLIALTAIYWIKSRRIDIANLLSSGRVFARVRVNWESTVDLGVLGINRAFLGQMFVHIDRAWGWIKHRVNAEPAQGPEVNIQIPMVAGEAAAEEQVIDEEAPIQEPEVVQEHPIEELDIIEAPARVRTQEEQNLHRCIEELEALEIEGLPGTMTTEEAILLVMTRRAAANGKGVICYSLTEKHSQHGRDHQPEIHQHQILRPHNLYYKLHTSRENIFRPDEPDCAICYTPLVNGEPMVTHDTCRRTFHEECYAESLRRSKCCPFDREWFVTRTAAHVAPAPVINPVPNGGGVEHHILGLPNPVPAHVAWAALVQERRPQPQPQQPPQPQVQLPQHQVLPLEPQAQPPQAQPPQAQPPQAQPPQAQPPQAQPPQAQVQAQRVRIRRSQPLTVGRAELPVQRRVGQRNRPLLAGSQVQQPGNHTNQNNGPHNDGRPPNNGRQPNTQSARIEGRRPWR